MKHLVHLLAAIALLVWATALVRNAILQVGGDALRSTLAQGLRNRLAAAAAGLGVTALVQSSTATGLIVAGFAAQQLVPLHTALAVMLGADIGSSLMAVVFSFDLKWLSPVFILAGVVLATAWPQARAAAVGRALIGVGLMLLALRLIAETAGGIVRTPAVEALLQSLSSDLLINVTVGVILTIMSHSSLAVVLLTAGLCASGALAPDMALAVVVGVNLGGGILGVLITRASPMEARHVMLGNLLCKTLVSMLVLPLLGEWVRHAGLYLGDAALVVTFHLAFNVLLAVLCIGIVGVVARLLQRWMAVPRNSGSDGVASRIHHLDPAALATPSLAIACAAREAMRQADLVETMLAGMIRVLRENDVQFAQTLRKMDDAVDEHYSAIKSYLTKMPPDSLDEDDRRRWSGIIHFIINLEQVGDIVERVIDDVEARKIRAGRSFSDAGLAEICEMHARLLANLRLAMSVFLTGSCDDARKLMEEKARFRSLERAYASAHLARLTGNTARSVETSALHLDLISELKRINSHICAVAQTVPEREAAQSAAVGVA
ncbi:Na/Pi cotransporter family protein [Ramlibacter sp.]|uniref:Na/Pi cotransporter family protein n=1 Tax=Ramlibacter sp. TaxID=1917967 RepID=UPI003D15224D